MFGGPRIDGVEYLEKINLTGKSKQDHPFTSYYDANRGSDVVDSNARELPPQADVVDFNAPELYPEANGAVSD